MSLTKSISNKKTAENVATFDNKFNGGGRSNYLQWDDFFMATAFLAAQRSKDPCTQVGACIVNSDNRIVGTGYNGMPHGCDDHEFPWGKIGSKENQKYMYVCHAEMNAVLNKNSYDLKNCRMYVGLFPCNECAKVIIQSGIREVIYISDANAHKIETKASKRMFDAAGVKYWQYIPVNQRIVIEFNVGDEQIPDSSTCTPIKVNRGDARQIVEREKLIQTLTTLSLD